MSLFIATLITGLYLIARGGLFLANPAGLEAKVRAFPRSQVAAYVLCGIGGAWFLYKISQLGEADFGNYSQYLILFFGAILVGSFLWVRDFLAVRGAAILALLISNELLKAAFAQYESPQRLFLVSLVYVWIVIAIYLGTVPFRMRDWIDWLYAKPLRLRALAFGQVTYGILLVGVAFSY